MEKPHSFLYDAVMENILRTKLTTALSPLILEIEDESHKHASHAGAKPWVEHGQSTHFHIKIVSALFTPLTRLERYRMVHDILKEELAGPIHALSLNLQTPEDIR